MSQNVSNVGHGYCNNVEQNFSPPSIFYLSHNRALRCMDWLLNLVRSRPQYSGMQTSPKSDQRLRLEGAHKEGRAPCWKMAYELTQCQNFIFREMNLSLLYIFPSARPGFSRPQGRCCYTTNKLGIAKGLKNSG